MQQTEENKALDFLSIRGQIAEIFSLRKDFPEDPIGSSFSRQRARIQRGLEFPGTRRRALWDAPDRLILANFVVLV